MIVTIVWLLLMTVALMYGVSALCIFAIDLNSTLGMFAKRKEESVACSAERRAAFLLWPGSAIHFFFL